MKHKSKESFDVNKVYNAIEKYTDIDQFAHGYAEPGYTQEHENHPVLFADWNPVPEKFMDWIEDHFDIEWSDEWLTCDSCGKAFRCSGSSYGWSMYGHVFDGYGVCGDCIKELPGDYIEHLVDNHGACDTIGLDLESMGFRVLNDNRFESGMHQGMNDDPKTIFDEMQKAHPDYEFVFSGLEPSQFYMSYSICGRLKQSV